MTSHLRVASKSQPSSKRGSSQYGDPRPSAPLSSPMPVPPLSMSGLEKPRSSKSLAIDPKGRRLHFVEHNRERVRMDARLFLSSISLTGSTPPTSAQISTEIDRGDEQSKAAAAAAAKIRQRKPIAMQHLSGAQPQFLQQSRINLTSHNGSPFMSYSVIPFSQTTNIRENKTAQIHLGIMVDEKRPNDARKKAESCRTLLESSAGRYTSSFIDVPNIGQGKHKTLNQMQSYTFSVILHVKPADLIRDLNEMWSEMHPDINITLSKLRSLKRELIEFGIKSCGLDVATVAMSHFYFEQLVGAKLISKPNRKLCAAVCLILAVKFLEHKDMVTLYLQKLFRLWQDRWQLSAREILAYEFPVYKELHFDLHVRPELLLPCVKQVVLHLQRTESEDFLEDTYPYLVSL
eukprot:m.143590 g.143590  ORF g.143590 m.143590 type:complete len:404 (-) comp17701_c0_seq5:374-1585(-)